MGKRKRKEHNDEYIRRKIRRLEKKLHRDSRRYKDRDDRSETCSSADLSSDVYRIDENEDSLYSDEDRPVTTVASVVTTSSPPLLPVIPLHEEEHMAPQTSSTDPNQQSEVPEEILIMLGESKTIEEPLGEAIPKEISERWGRILVDGISKDQRQSLYQKILIPENFLLARAPKLNPEVNSILSDSAKNRDKRLEKAQNQLGLGIAGLVNLTNDLIKKDTNKLDIIKKLSEISQILLDLHYENTVNRRKLITPLLDKAFWNTTQCVKRGTYLFGDQLGENIKNTKDIEKTAQQIKKPVISRPNPQRKNTHQGNLRFPPRQLNYPKPAAAAQHYDPQPSTSTRRAPAAPQPPRQRRLPPHRTRDRRQR